MTEEECVRETEGAEESPFDGIRPLKSLIHFYLLMSLCHYNVASFPVALTLKRTINSLINAVPI